MAKNKTTETGEDVLDFINEFADTEEKRKDSYELLELMQDISGYEAKMWGPSIVGFGSCHYKNKSEHEGGAPLIGFSPGKAAIFLYVFTGLNEHENLLTDLGKFKRGKPVFISRNSQISIEKN